MTQISMIDADYQKHWETNKKVSKYHFLPVGPAIKIIFIITISVISVLFDVGLIILKNHGRGRVE